MHTSEEVLTTNTARLAAKALTNCEIRIHGRRDERMETGNLIQPGRTSLLLFPSPQAVELNAELVASIESPINLIVPDANWRQTAKFVRHEPAVAGIRHVKLAMSTPSEYRLRIQRYPQNLCTLEAIARALGTIESVDAQMQLETLLRILVERTLWSRGKIRATECLTAGIPREAIDSGR